MKTMKRPILLSLFVISIACVLRSRSHAVEIPLEALTPVRIGYIDLQRVFDTYPEKSFAEGDLLREIEKRKRELGRRQTDITLLRQQINTDDSAFAQARAGQAIVVPANAIPEPEPAPVPVPVVSSPTVAASTAPAPVEPYPTDDPLSGLPGHGFQYTPKSATASSAQTAQTPTRRAQWPALDLLAGATAPVQLSPDALSQLQDRITFNKKKLDRAIVEFKGFRTNAVGDMKSLQTQKTYGVMAKIYAVLQGLARDEGITVVLDKAYVLYGEDTVDLSDKLITRLQQEGV
jgi:Skp family chaperone for outer membrane proteins